MATEDDLQEKGKGLWHNIHQKRKRGERMRKKGEKGAPTAAAMKSASEASDFKLTPAREKELEKIAKAAGFDNANQLQSELGQLKVLIQYD